MDYSIKPIKTQHSVERSVLFLNYTKPLDAPTLRRLTRNVLPMEERYKIKTSRHESRVDFVYKNKSTGNISWVIRFDDKQIGIECLEYSRWEVFLAEGMKFLRILGSLRAEKAIFACGLAVYDDFEVRCVGNFDLRLLFNEDSLYIPRAFLDAQLPSSACECEILSEGSEPSWRLHKNKLRISSASHRKEHKILFTIEDQNIVIFEQNQFAIDDPAHEQTFLDIFRFLHEKNKKNLRSVLEAKTLKAIGL